jgi:enoyl-CoA hydratase/carnithine racemase
MTYKTLLFDLDEEGIATITLNRPEKLNSINSDMRGDFAALADRLSYDANVRVVIFTGAGRAFSAGGDIGHFEREWLTPSFRAHSHRLSDFFNHLEALEKPVIAALNGITSGAGLQLALVCDIRLASVEATIGFRENFIGLIPGHGGTVRLANLIGSGRAKELIFLGELISAERAESIGLVSKVFPHDTLLPEARALAVRLLQRAPQALGLVKQLLNAANNVDVQSGLMIESLAQSILLKTEDHREGLRAFREKRKPHFEGK